MSANAGPNGTTSEGWGAVDQNLEGGPTCFATCSPTFSVTPNRMPAGANSDAKPTGWWPVSRPRPKPAAAKGGASSSDRWNTCGRLGGLGTVGQATVGQGQGIPT